MPTPEAPAAAAATADTEPTTVEAWRVFGLAPDAILFAPFAPNFWPDAAVGLRLWQSVEQVAGCVAEDHPAPAEGCTCGIRGVVDRDILLAAAGTRVVDVEGGTVLADAGVFGKVELSGRMLPGVNIPADDPETTLRAERARLLQIHLGPAHTVLAPDVAAAYGEVEVVTYTEDEWARLVPSRGRPAVPRRLEPEEAEAAFVADVLRVGFGNRDLTDPRAPKALVGLAQDMAKGLRTHRLSIPDVARVLFDSPAQPTLPQVREFIRSALDNFAPGCVFVLGSFESQHTQPITLRESFGRMGQNLFVNAFSRPRER